MIQTTHKLTRRDEEEDKGPRIGHQREDAGGGGLGDGVCELDGKLVEQRVSGACMCQCQSVYPAVMLALARGNGNSYTNRGLWHNVNNRLFGSTCQHIWRS